MKCKTCGQETVFNKKLCCSCLENWSCMRGQIWKFNEKRFGKLSPANLKVCQSETKRLEKIWKKDKELFNKTICQ